MIIAPISILNADEWTWSKMSDEKEAITKDEDVEDYDEAKYEQKGGERVKHVV